MSFGFSFLVGDVAGVFPFGVLCESDAEGLVVVLLLLAVLFADDLGSLEADVVGNDVPAFGVSGVGEVIAFPNKAAVVEGVGALLDGAGVDFDCGDAMVDDVGDGGAVFVGDEVAVNPLAVGEGFGAEFDVAVHLRSDFLGVMKGQIAMVATREPAARMPLKSKVKPM